MTKLADRLASEVASARHAASFLVGLRRFVRAEPPSLEDAKSLTAGEVARRGDRFLTSLDRFVWSHPASPYLALLEHSGFKADDVRDLVRTRGLEHALTTLRDAGVYVSYAEWRGQEPIRRGSFTLDVEPREFFNPRGKADVLSTTGGSRSDGLPVVSSFEYALRGAARERLREEIWEIDGAPRAVWLPVLPSAAGLTTTLKLIAAGNPPDVWFTPVDPATLPLSIEKRFANRYLPVIARAAGAAIPQPEYVPPAAPQRAIDWARESLRDHGRAVIGGYASSLVSLAVAAREQGVDLTGLVMNLSGEPVTAAKATAIRASGATPNTRYGFMQLGGSAGSCPYTNDEELHVTDNNVAVIDREVVRPDGVEVRALMWTGLQAAPRNIFLNVENDDYGDISRDDPPCRCLLGQLGYRTMLRNVRGISKVVTGGITLTGEVVEAIVGTTLPAAFGGGPADYQFVEHETAEGASRVTLRVHPRLAVDEARVRDAVAAALNETEPGLLASEVWKRSDTFRVERAAPMTTKSGKVLPFERL